MVDPNKWSFDEKVNLADNLGILSKDDLQKVNMFYIGSLEKINELDRTNQVRTLDQLMSHSVAPNMLNFDMNTAEEDRQFLRSQNWHGFLTDEDMTDIFDELKGNLTRSTTKKKIRESVGNMRRSARDLYKLNKQLDILKKE